LVVGILLHQTSHSIVLKEIYICLEFALEFSVEELDIIVVSESGILTWAERLTLTYPLEEVQIGIKCIAYILTTQ